MVQNLVLDLFCRIMPAAIFSSSRARDIGVPQENCFLPASAGIEKQVRIGSCVPIEKPRKRLARTSIFFLFQSRGMFLSKAQFGTSKYVIDHGLSRSMR